MERKVGSRFNFGNVRLEVRELNSSEPPAHPCRGCFFRNHKGACADNDYYRITGECSIGSRKDRKDVIFGRMT